MPEDPFKRAIDTRETRVGVRDGRRDGRDVKGVISEGGRDDRRENGGERARAKFDTHTYYTHRGPNSLHPTAVVVTL